MEIRHACGTELRMTYLLLSIYSQVSDGLANRLRNTRAY